MKSEFSNINNLLCFYFIHTLFGKILLFYLHFFIILVKYSYIKGEGIGAKAEDNYIVAGS